MVAEASLHFSPSLIHAVHTVVLEPVKVSKQAEFSPQHVTFEPAEQVSPAGIHAGGGGGACVVDIVVVGGGGDVELVIADKTHLYTLGREEAPEHFFRRTAITSPDCQEFMV